MSEQFPRELVIAAKRHLPFRVTLDFYGNLLRWIVNPADCGETINDILVDYAWGEFKSKLVAENNDSDYAIIDDAAGSDVRTTIGLNGFNVEVVIYAEGDLQREAYRHG